MKPHALPETEARVLGLEHPVDVGARGVPQTRWGLWWEHHPVMLRVLAVSALAWGSVYLVWRLFETGRHTDPAAFYVLWLVELFNFTSLAFLVFYGWAWSAPHRPATTADHSVDVFVATYDEPLEVVEATLAGCAALRYPHKTFLLDDGRRWEMAALAAEWGAQHITRPDRSHAKAGNINNALGCTNGELIFCLDADHIPLPDALDAIVGYFDDDMVALVQSPHDFYNHDSVQHYEVGRHEQSLFFEVVCPGKDRSNSVFWCGSAAVLRRKALVEAGGVGTETIAEDFHTTIKMHRAGWKTRYHDEVLVQGLAPVDLDGYLLQRDRWARGNLAVLSLPESPLGRRCGLGLRQRVSYFASLFAYAAGAARLVMIGLLAVVLLAGVLPARMSVLSLEVFWAPWTLLAIVSASALCRGHLRMGESSHYTLVTAAIYTRALRCALLPSKTKFKVTPKQGADSGGLRSLSQLWLVCLLGGTLAAGLVWRSLAISGEVHARPLPVWAATMALALGTWELYRVLRSLGIVIRRRQRREQFRFACLAPAMIWDAPDAVADIEPQSTLKTPANRRRRFGRVVDISLSGIGLLAAEEFVPGNRLEVAFSLPGLNGEGLPVSLTCCVRSARPDSAGAYGDKPGWRLGAEVVAIDQASRYSLVNYCYVVHPWERLRTVRLEAQTGSLVSGGVAPRRWQRYRGCRARGNLDTRLRGVFAAGGMSR